MGDADLADTYGFDENGCPLPYFSRLPPSLFELVFQFGKEIGLGLLQIMLGLFTAYYGAGIRTVIVVGNAFIIIGMPLLIPILKKMALEVKGIQDFTPEFFTALLAAFVSAANASFVVLKISDKSRSMLQGFTTGMLFSGFLMGFWLPALNGIEPPLEEKVTSWIKLAGASAPGVFLSAVAANEKTRALVWSFSFALMGGFLFIGVVSHWIGGGFISLTALTGGNFGACAQNGFISMGLFAFVLLTGMTCSLRKCKPPGCIGALFCLLFMLEDYFKAMNDPEEKQRQLEAKGKKKSGGSSKGGGGGGADKPDLEKMFGAPAETISDDVEHGEEKEL